MPLFLITETEEYRIHADTPEEAERKFLDDENNADWMGVTKREVEPID